MARRENDPRPLPQERRARMRDSRASQRGIQMPIKPEPPNEVRQRVAAWENERRAYDQRLNEQYANQSQDLRDAQYEAQLATNNRVSAEWNAHIAKEQLDRIERIRQDQDDLLARRNQRGHW